MSLPEGFFLLIMSDTLLSSMKAEDSQAVPMVQLNNMRECFIVLR